jgi:hypothetical protein
MTLIWRLLLVATLIVCGLQSWAASVSGRAVLRGGLNPQGPCRATLRKEIDRRGALELNLESASDGKTSFSVPLNQSGYFRFFGVTPGKHMLVVECPTASSVRELDIKTSDVQTNKEIRINPPLLLEDLTLAITVTPKVDPEGQPWQLTVDATMPRLRQIADKATTTDGRWAQHGLVAGNYRVTIKSSDGKPWLQRFFNLRSDSGSLLLRLPFMRVSGQVHLSTQPVRARLTFFNNAGGEPMTLTSGDDGFFQGLLPVTPSVERTSWTVEAHAMRPHISRRLSDVSVQSADEPSAWLDLALPAFAVHGSVDSKNGQPQSGVQVTFEDTSSGAKTSTATDDAGGFELSDLPPGKYTAVAESIDGVSEHMPFQVIQGIESELKLVLKPSESIPFHVVSDQGPVSNASVQVWMSPGMPRYFTHTDQNGGFEVKLPRGTTEVGLTVGAPGYALKLTRLQVSSESDSSSDENTIALDESSGTLMLDLQPSGGAVDSSATPYLVHDGAIEAVGTLAGWGGDQALSSSDGPIIVKAIEPGNYVLCFLTDPTQLTSLWFGALPSDRCRRGSLEQGETLTLAVQ